MCRTFAGKQNAEHAGVLLQMDLQEFAVGKLGTEG